ncbi:hypothetical protein AB0N19_22170, partial [Streptomyces sp. NPDC051132]
MDAQGRGRAENIDPADQWVLNPNTGEYELRLSPSAAQPPVPGPRRPSARDGAGAADGRPRRAARRIGLALLATLALAWFAAAVGFG